MKCIRMKVSAAVVEIIHSVTLTLPGFIRAVFLKRVMGTCLESVPIRNKCSKAHMIGSRIWKGSGCGLMKSSGVSFHGLFAMSGSANASTSLS